MSVRMPRKSELPWSWTPWSIMSGLGLVVVMATLVGLAHHSAQARDAALGFGPPPFAPVPAWLMGGALFALGVGIGLLGAPAFIRFGLQGWEQRIAHYRTYGRPWWRPLAASFTRQYWRSLRDVWSSYPLGAVVWLTAIGVMWGSAVCGGLIEYAIAHRVGAGPGIAFLGSLAGFYGALLRFVSRLED